MDYLPDPVKAGDARSRGWTALTYLNDGYAKSAQAAVSWTRDSPRPTESPEPRSMDHGTTRSCSGAGEPLSSSLLELAQNGDRAALETLVARYRPRLVRWASGRLPRWARDITDTQDLVQETLFQTFRRIGSFEQRGEGALQAYLRQVLLNRIREELRRLKRKPAKSDVDSQAPDDGSSPLDEAIGREAVERYERALAGLRAEDREAIVARVELGCTNREMAALLNKPSGNAARMAIERALVRLAKRMAGQDT